MRHLTDSYFLLLFLTFIYLIIYLFVVHVNLLSFYCFNTCMHALSKHKPQKPFVLEFLGLSTSLMWGASSLCGHI